MSSQPIQSAVGVSPLDAEAGRNEHGQFVRGNRASVGHRDSSSTAVADLRRALLAEVKPDDMRRVVRKLVEEAASGNVFAARELFDRTLGKCKPAEESAGEDVQTFLEGLWRAWGVRAPDAASPEPEAPALPPGPA